MVTVNPMVVREPKRAWEHGEREAGLLDALRGAPMRPRAVAEEVGLDAAAVRLALTRRARAGQVLHATTWPCLPPKRPWRPPCQSPPRSPPTTRMTIHSPLRTTGPGNQTTWM